MKFLFWNLHNKPIFKEIAELALEECVDVLLFAEFPEQKDSSIIELLSELNQVEKDKYYSLDIISDAKINIFCNSKYKQNIIHRANNQREAIIGIIIPPMAPVLLIVFHCQSKVNWSDDDQLAHSCNIKNLVDKWEEDLNCNRTILCGDFNMNPFDKGVISHTGINAVMDRNIAMKVSRTICKKKYRYFYNPMWGFLGDLGKGKVSGTIRYSSSIPTSYHWQLFDQVLLRPELISIFDNDELDIITRIGDISLLTPQQKISEKYSDHLPIKFKLKI